VDGYKDNDTQAADAMQDVGQHRSFALVPEPIDQADVPLQAHLRLLELQIRLDYYLISKPLKQSDNTHRLFVSDILMQNNQASPAIKDIFHFKALI